MNAHESAWGPQGREWAGEGGREGGAEPNTHKAFVPCAHYKLHRLA